MARQLDSKRRNEASQSEIADADWEEKRDPSELCPNNPFIAQSVGQHNRDERGNWKIQVEPSV